MESHPSVSSASTDEWESDPGVPGSQMHELVHADADLQPPDLRTLDAIHLATALLLQRDIAGLITYERRLAGSAAAAGIAVLTPHDLGVPPGFPGRGLGPANVRLLLMSGRDRPR